MLFELTGETKKIGNYTLQQVKYLKNNGEYEIGGWIDKPELLLQDPRNKVGANSYVYGTKFAQRFVVGENCTIANCIIQCKFTAYANVTLCNCILWQIGDNWANCEKGLSLCNKEFHAIGRIDARLNNTKLFKEIFYKDNYALVADKCCGTGCVTVDWAEAWTIVNDDLLWEKQITGHKDDDRVKKIDRDWLRQVIIDYMPENEKRRLQLM